MSYLRSEKIYKGAVFVSDSESVTLKTFGISDKQKYNTDEQGRKTVFAGTVYPSDDSNAIGIVYNDIDVTDGEYPGSVIVGGRLYKDRLDISPEAVTALKGRGIFFDDAPAICKIFIFSKGYTVTEAGTFTAENIAEASDDSELEIIAVKCGEDAEGIFTANLSDGTVTVEKTKAGSGTIICTVKDKSEFTEDIRVKVTLQ